VFKIINAILHVGAMGMVSFVLYLLFNATFKQIPTSNMILLGLFACVWALVIWMLYRELLGVGFACLAIGSSDIPVGAKTASVSMVWLILAYFFHTFGELSLSPVGLTYVSKLAPVRMLGLMFGVFFIAYFVSSWLAGMTGSYIDPIVEHKGISYFFWVFAIIPWVSALFMIAGKGTITKLMNGID
jgi:POT family proton-dependent oligopeptide transporter